MSAYRNLGWLLLVFVIVGLLAAGCGSGDEAAVADEADIAAALG